jgi:hypothetical protein
MMMKKQELLQFKDKKVKIFLKNNYCYTGQIIEFNESSLLFFDKFGLTSSFIYEDVIAISEVRV